MPNVKIMCKSDIERMITLELRRAGQLFNKELERIRARLLEVEARCGLLERK